jgi:hypothetical protein
MLQDGSYRTKSKSRLVPYVGERVWLTIWERKWRGPTNGHCLPPTCSVGPFREERIRGVSGWPCCRHNFVHLICLQSIVEELLWGVLAWSNKAFFFVDFKHRWRRLDNSLRESFLTWKERERELPYLKRERERERELPCLKRLSWRKFVSPRIPLSLGWGPLFIEICRGSQILFQCNMA